MALPGEAGGAADLMSVTGGKKKMLNDVDPNGILRLSQFLSVHGCLF